MKYQVVNMKRTRSITSWIVAGIVACFWLPGCSSEQPLGEMQPLEIEATIPGLTKADTPLEKTAFVADDSITVSKSSTTSAVYKFDATNSRWLPKVGTGLSTTGNEAFTASWKPEGFTAILSDQQTAGHYQKSYELTASATASANLVQFSFAPAAAKITIVVNYALESSGGSASITGSHLLSSDDGDQTINFWPLQATGKKHTFVGLVFPGSGKSYQISVVATPSDGSPETKTHSMTGKTLKAGYNYTYNFSTDNTPNLILNSVTVTDFKPETDTNVGEAT